MHKKGISLIALVLTLIILLILAAISIGMFIGRDRLTTDLKHKIDNKEYSGNLGISEQRRYYDASE